MEHENDPDIDEPYIPPAGNVLGSTEEQSSPLQSPSGTTERMFIWSYITETSLFYIYIAVFG